MRVLAYPLARKASLTSPYLFNHNGTTHSIPLGGEARIPTEAALAILERDGDIIKQVGLDDEDADELPPEKPLKPAPDFSGEYGDEVDTEVNEQLETVKAEDAAALAEEEEDEDEEEAKEPPPAEAVTQAAPEPSAAVEPPPAPKAPPAGENAAKGSAAAPAGKGKGKETKAPPPPAKKPKYAQKDSALEEGV